MRDGKAAELIREAFDNAEAPLILDPRQPLKCAHQMIARLYTFNELPTLHHYRGEFFLWQGGAYRSADADEIRAVMYTFLDSAKVQKGNGEVAPFAPNRAKVGNVLEALAAAANLPSNIEPPVWLDPVPDMNSPPEDFIVLRNGLLHLPTRDFFPPTPAFFVINALPVIYDADASDPEAWLKFLHSLWPDDPESIETLQEIFGLMLVSDTSHQKIFLLVGPKRSGKGTIVRLLTAMLGADSTASPTLGALGTNFGLAPLIGKRLATITDARLSAKSDQAPIAERLLSISGEDGHTIDRKFLPAWTGRLPARFLILTNELPRIADASGALASRFIVLQLRNSFYGHEDHGLAARLIAELPGIFLWSLKGLERLRLRGAFLQPDSAREALDELEALGSPVLAFIKDRCVVAAGCTCDTAEMFAEWEDWCNSDHRRETGTVQTFGRNLRSAVPGLETIQQREDGARKRQYVGINLK